MTTTQVTTLWPVSSLTELRHEWRILAFRPNGSGAWQWSIGPDDVRALQPLVRDGSLITAHRRDGDGTRLVAKVAGRGK